MKCAYCGGNSRRQTKFEMCKICELLTMDDGIVVLVVNDEQDINKLGNALSNKDEKLFDEVSLSDDFLYVRGQSVKAAAGFGLVEIDRAKSIIDRGWAIITQKEFDDQYETG